MGATQGDAYTVTFVEDAFGLDPQDDNVDVLVDFSNGERYTATFFTPDNIRGILEKYSETGECLGGEYMWGSHMIVIAHLTIENVKRVVADLLANDAFTGAFEGPFEIDDSGSFGGG